MKRLFLGVRPTDDCVAALSGYQAALQARGAAWDYLSPRWIPPESFHLTLHFLGQTPPSRVDALRRALFRVWPELAQGGPFEQVFSEWAFFPESGKARVGAVGSSVPHYALLVWNQTLSRLLLEQGFQVEKRPFHPHITLVRFSKPGKLAAPPFPEPLAFPASGLVLYESVGSEDGPEYVPVQEFKLAPT